MMKKRCTTCKIEKLFAEFSKFKTSKDGHHNQCKSCVKVYNQRTKADRKRWREENKEQIDRQNKRWREENKGRRAATEAKRRAAKLNRTPPWLTKQDFKNMRRLYELAQKKGMQVDHIIPLQGRYISGLHVPSNLQLLSVGDNLAKKNIYENDRLFM